METVLADIDDKPIVKDCCWVGTSKTNLICLVKFSLNSHSHVAQVLKSTTTRKLCTVDGYKLVYVCPDRIVKERKAHKKLVKQLKKKRDSEADHILQFTRHNIITLSVTVRTMSQPRLAMMNN